MNKIEIEGGGFPGTSKTWRFIRDMINQVHGLTAAIGGENYIASGCIVTGSNVSPGVVVINSEVLPFQGGRLAATVYVKEVVEKTTYLKDLNNDGQGDAIDTYFERRAQFGSGGSGNAIASISWVNLNRIQPHIELQKRIPPVKTALPYWGSEADISTGWQLCDGTNGTPDLRGKFLVGKSPEVEFNSLGKTGGAKKVTLSELEMPNHKHPFTGIIPPHAHKYRDRYMTEHFDTGGIDGVEYAGNNLAGTNGDNDNRYFYYKNAVTSPSVGQTMRGTTVSKGGNRAHQNLPPYYTLAYITYIG